MPNEGLLDLSFTYEKISAFLRSMDVGVIKDIPNAKIKLFGDIFEILFYDINDNKLTLHLNNEVKIYIEKEKK